MDVVKMGCKKLRMGGQEIWMLTRKVQTGYGSKRAYSLDAVIMGWKELHKAG